MSRKYLAYLAPFLAGLALIGVLAFIPDHAVFAQEVAESLEEVGSQTGLGSEDPKIVVAKIIRAGLGILGVIVVLLVMYGGWMWMTAGGNAEKIETAKKVLVRAGIGLAIIMLSFAITSFVLSSLLNATSGGGSGNGGGGSGGVGLGGGSSSSFTVTDYSPDGAVAIRNVQLVVTFSKLLDADTVQENIVVTNAASGENVAGTITVNGNRATFVPDAACPSPNEDRSCFAADTQFTVTVDDAIESSNGISLACGSDRCTSSFTTGSLVDTEDPVALVTDPEDGDGVASASFEAIQVHATDDSEVATAAFAVDGSEIDSVGAEGDVLSDVTIETLWDTAAIENGERYKITVTVVDIAGNTDEDSVTVTARPAWCFNGEVDTDLGETGLDCGGDASSAEYCGACDGSSCSENSDCSSGSCVDGICVASPEIESISPASGAPGTFVTITGSGFGSSGTVTFSKEDGSPLEASVPSCGTWTSTQIIVEVPADAADGPITVTNRDGYADATDDDNGTMIADFDVNDVVRPKLCNLSPDHGEPTDKIEITGADFGDTQGDSVVRFGVNAAGSYTIWESSLVAATVPSVTAGTYDVVMTVDGVESNAVSFDIEGTSATTPVISGLDPSSGAVGDYVTISGTGFGALTGSVWFVSEESGEETMAAVDFPDACLDNWWEPEEITVIVPELLAGDYTVYVTSQSGVDSESVEFTVEDGEPGPGICGISPESGDVGTEVTIYGQNFGDEGAVTFYSGVVASTDGAEWSDEEISLVSVPGGAATGPLSVTVNGEESNGVDFAIGTTDGEVTATAAPASYGWYFSTGTIPATPEIVVECSDTTVSGVPNQRFTAEVCTNAVVYAQFTTLMNAGSVTDAVTIERCTAGGDDVCDETENVTEKGELSISSSTTATSFRWTPTELQTSSTYLVTVSTAATSEDGAALEEAVSWQFTTKENNENCEVEEVLVVPGSSVLEAEGDVERFTAQPISECVVLANTYSWEWSVDTSYADFTTSEDVDGSVCGGSPDDCASVEALAEGVTEVTALEPASNSSGSAVLTINFTDPYVATYSPNCDEACVNAQATARFNTRMSQPSIEEGGVTLYTCDNELCTGLTEHDEYSVSCPEDVDGSNECQQVYVTPSRLTAGTFYRVVISGDVTSASGVPLTRTNYNGDYSWTFRVREDETICSVERIEITPDAARATTVGERQVFTVNAYGAADACSESGQLLAPEEYNWSWTDPIEDNGENASISVAEWAYGVVDTDPTGIPAGCTASCTSAGSEPYAAICGDGEIGVGEECEDGNFTDGDGCSTSCLREGQFSSDVCGDGVRNWSDPDLGGDGSGEDCDDGNTRSGDGCSATCLNEGSNVIGSVCGNNDVAHDDALGGEDCDDGNSQSGDGCSAQCINEGAPTREAIGGAICGDSNTVEPYENCDDGNTADGDGCSSRCLLEGSSASYATPSVCGQGGIGTGEECDDGNAVDGDGCSSMCLLEGSSVSFTVPSFCGDGEYGTGEVEACEETSAGDGNIDNLQLAFITEDAPMEVDEDTNEAIATIYVAEPNSEFITSATYTLSCSAASDEQCDDSSLYGVGMGNCCIERPTVDLHPTEGEGNVCRNASIYGIFTKEMDLTSFFDELTDGTEEPNMYLVLDMTTVDEASCDDIDGHTTAYAAPRHWAARAWFNLRRFVIGAPAHAATSGDCVVPVDGFTQEYNEADGTYTVRMRYDVLLKEDATYTLYIEGDSDYTDANAEGVHSKNGVALAQEFIAPVTFETGEEICTLDVVSIEDADEDSAFYFSQEGEEHEFTATAVSYTTGTPQEIEPIEGVYDWSWSGWDEDSDEEIVTVDGSTTEGEENSSSVTAMGENGDANVTVTATITADTAGGTTGDTVLGSEDVTAYLCENPWPEIAEFPFNDDEMNFSTYYCRDAGEDGSTGDLYDVTAVTPEDRPISSDIVLKEYLFKVNDGSGDAIGVRIVSNAEYLSPMNWFAAQGFSGDPVATTVDGFEAVTDGRTAYVAAPNQSGSELYSNIYVISYNEGASDDTVEIYNQMLENFTFATNVTDTALCLETDYSYTTVTDEFGNAVSCTTDSDCDSASSEICLDNECTVELAEVTYLTDSDGEIVACTSDSDCTTELIGDELAGITCANEKAKLQRDTKRLADMTTIAAKVEDFGGANGTCSDTTAQSCTSDSDCPTDETCESIVPTLASGTYLRSAASSAWSSWSDLLGAALDDNDLVTDPINVYEGCGEGSYTDYESSTCVNQTRGEYICPDNSYVYHYRAVGSRDYELYADLEYTGADWYSAIDADTDDEVAITVGNSASSASGFSVDAFCDGTSVYGSTGTCGDGVISPDEQCEIGDVGGATDVCDPDEDVDSDGDGDSFNDWLGTTSQVCGSSCIWETDPDAVCSAGTCGDGIVDTGEDCDDGAYNGRYGYCGSSCNYETAAYCGDGELAGSEVCDCGSSVLGAVPSDARPYGGSGVTCAGFNGTYDKNPSATCAWDCRGPAAYCGDGEVNGSEQCDGETDTYDGEYCNTFSGSSAGNACTSDEECKAGARNTFLRTFAACGGSAGLSNACTADADGRPTTRTRNCEDDGSAGESCEWETDDWSSLTCEPLGSCGDGTVDVGEECDDGNTVATDECTSSCTLNVCGDGYLYSGVESCDEGDLNGEGCTSGYESSCTSCSISCRYEVSSGAFCGDGEINGDEYCDASAIPYSWWVPEIGVVGACAMSEEDSTSIYTDADGDEYQQYCVSAGICNGGTDNGELCVSDTACGSGDCVFPTCADNCASTCPDTYASTSLLLEPNNAGARASSSVQLYSYDEDSTSTLPNAATITVPACNVISGLTADIDMSGVDLPETYVVFITDLSRTMKYRVVDDTDPSDLNGDGDTEDAGEDSRLEVAQESMASAVASLYDQLGDNVQIAGVAFKGLVSGQCYTTGSSCTSDSQCTGSGNYCIDTTSEVTEDETISPFGNLSSWFVADDESSLLTEIAGYFVDPKWPSGSRDSNGILQSTNGHGTFTYEALVEARHLFEDIEASAIGDNVRFIGILLSDGEYTNNDPMDEAQNWDEAGYELYTATIGDDADFITQMEEWSSQDEFSDRGIDYAYVADTESEIDAMYEEIIDSILSIAVTFISADDADGDTSLEVTTGSIEEGRGVSLPWPEGFVCDPYSEQELPVRINFQGEGQIEVSNVQIEYCAP